MSNQPHEPENADGSDEPVEPSDPEPDFDEGGPGESTEAGYPNVPEGVKDGELPPAP